MGVHPSPAFIQVSIVCAWCSVPNLTDGRATYCTTCHHRVDLPKAFCDCAQCDAAILDTQNLRRALDQVAPGARFADLGHDQQSHIVRLAQQLKDEARKRLATR